MLLLLSEIDGDAVENLEISSPLASVRYNT